jgi:hypothetical protein
VRTTTVSVKALSDDRNWGTVELFRQQHGRLPKDNDDCHLDFALACKKAACNIAAGEVSPDNAAEMLKVAGMLLGDIFAAAEPLVRDLDKVIQPEAGLVRLREALRLPTPKGVNKDE